MALALITGQIVQVRMYTHLEGQEGINNIFFRVTAVGFPPATDLDVAFSMDGILGPLWKDLMSNQAFYGGAGSQVVWPLPIQVNEVATVNAGFGTVTGIALPKQTAGLLSWVTLLSGRSYRGRIYLPFPAINDLGGDGRPIASYLTRLGLIGTLISGGVWTVSEGGRTATLQPIIWHARAPKPPAILPPIHSWTDIRGARVGSGFATQRRRSDYGRLNPIFP